MDTITIFSMQILTSVFVFGIVAAWYVWPSLTKLSRNSALVPLLFVQVPRYVGMTLFIPYMVDPKLPREFISNAAYGDLLEGAGLHFDLCSAGQLARCRSSGVGGQYVGIYRPAKRITRRLAVECAELQSRHLLVYLYVLRAPGHCFPFDDLLDFDQAQVLGEIRVSDSVGDSQLRWEEPEGRQAEVLTQA